MESESFRGSPCDSQLLIMEAFRQPEYDSTVVLDAFCCYLFVKSIEILRLKVLRNYLTCGRVAMSLSLTTAISGDLQAPHAVGQWLGLALY